MNWKMKKHLFFALFVLLASCENPPCPLKACFTIEKDTFSVGETVPFQSCSMTCGSTDNKQHIWDYGDGSSDTLDNTGSASHAYNVARIYTVRLSMMVHGVIEDEASKTFTIIP
jgi:PKD repeat protein